MSNPADPSDDVAWAKAEAITDIESGPSASPETESIVVSEMTAPSEDMTNPETPLLTTTTTTIQVNSPVSGLGRYPCVINCPFCHRETLTRTRDTMGCTAVVAVVIILLIFWPLAWIPCCLPTCKATDHYCRQCNRRIARVEPCSND